MEYGNNATRICNHMICYQNEEINKDFMPPGNSKGVDIMVQGLNIGGYPISRFFLLAK